MANPSPDEGVRAALTQVLTYLEGQHAKTKSNGVVNADARRTIAALSTPVPEEGLPRGSASAAEFTVDPETVAIMDGLKKRFGVSTNVEVLKHALAEARAAKASAEAGDGVASALPSPLPSQGEPVAWIVEHEFKKRNPSLIFGGGGKVCFHGYDAKEKAEDLYSRLVARGDCEWIKFVPLYTAEALAAERARAAERIADLEDDVKRLHREKMEHFEARLAAEARADRAAEDEREARAELATCWEALQAQTDRVDRAAEDERDRLYAKAVRIGAADAEVFLIREGAAFPADRLRARNILKETPHGER